jgi:hypothetical protein
VIESFPLQPGASNHLIELRSEAEAELFQQLLDVFERKIRADEDSGAAIVDTEMVYGHLPEGGEASFLRALAQHQRFRFAMSTEYRDIGEIDRTTSMISGPFFTSAEFPWPAEPEGWIEPLFQIDLDVASEVAGFCVGNGLVQLWMNDQGSIVCHIPRTAVRMGEVTPVSCDQIDLGGERDRNIYNVEARQTREACWKLGGHQWIGQSQRSLDLHQMITMVLEGEILDREEKYPDYVLKDAKECVRMINVIQSGRNRPVSTANATLFGNYNPSNWDAGPEAVLLNYQSDQIIDFGSEAGGILFYSPGQLDGGCWFELEH